MQFAISYDIDTLKFTWAKKRGMGLMGNPGATVQDGIGGAGLAVRSNFFCETCSISCSILCKGVQKAGQIDTYQ